MRWLEGVIAVYIKKSCWTMSNIFAEKALATELISTEIIRLLTETANTVQLNMRDTNF